MTGKERDEPMPAYKDTKTNAWYVKFRYKDWTGQSRYVTKRGFSTKREALQWEREFLLEKSGSPDMKFADFVKVYKRDQEERLKKSTFLTKENIIETKILPYFGERPLRDITAADVIQWQNRMLSFRDPTTRKPYSKVYLKTIHNQLSAIFNHAVRFYHLPENPAKIAGNMGSEKETEMKFWTQSDYEKFSFALMDKPEAFYCFEVLYWCGIREGELLALTPADLDLEAKTMRINKTYQRIHGQDVITSPKTPKSNRVIRMPEFLCEELEDYLSMCFDLRPDDRLFPVTKSFLYHQMKSGAKAAGVPKIRVHDLRHSHVSLLIDMGFSAVAIAERMGHETIDITYRYAHLFPSVQTAMAVQLDHMRKGGAINVPEST